MPPPASPIRRVAIVEDQVAIRDLIRTAVDGIPGYRAIGDADNLESARELCRREKPDLIVLDLGLPGGSGLVLLPELRTLSPRTRVVVFSGILRSASIRRALLAGAHGLVDKNARLEEFEEAIREVGAGRVYFSRAASDELRAIVQRRPGDREPIVRLTEREKSVLRGVAEGLSSKQISARLGISRHTVASHRNRLSQKVRVRGVAQLSRFAVAIGLVDSVVEGAADASAE